MLRPYVAKSFSAEDKALFDVLVRRDHWVRRALAHVDFLALRASVEEYYRADFGSPGVEPLLLIKLEFLMYHDNLSDSQVFLKTETDLAYRLFLELGRDDHLPDVSTLGRFRARIGSEGHKALFHALLKQARTQGLVKDRLRIKDATHVIADIAVPAGLNLVAQARNRLLRAIEPFDAERVAGERVRVETIRTATDGRGNDVRLLARVEHLRDVLTWASSLKPPSDSEKNPTWQTLMEAIDIAHKVLRGHDDPAAGDKVRSVSDPDARRGRHGDFYDGYLVDVTVDADSQMFTAINVLPANGGESADTLELVRQEKAAHGNQIKQVSIDGVGYDGPILRQLKEDDGIEVFVPAKADCQPDRISADQFVLSADGSHVTCPAGQTSSYSQREESRHATMHRFAHAVCGACLLLAQCMDKLGTHGRSVRKNDYAAEYDFVRARSKTPEYAAIKKEHPLVERNLGHLMNRYGGRRARYRGRKRVLGQMMMGAMTANLKRMIRLLDDRAMVAFG